MSVRIVHVIESAGPGGAETILLELVRRAPSRGCSAVAVVPTADGWLGQALPPDARRVIGANRQGHAGPIDLPYVRALRRLFVAESPTLVHAHSFDSALYSSIALLGMGARLVTTFHGTADVLRTGLRNRIKWTLLRRTNAIVCVSDSLARVARSTPGLPASRFRSIPNGVDLSRIGTERSRALRSQLGLSDNTMLLGALGNVRKPKGYPELLAAIADLRARGLDVHLVIAGDNRGALGERLVALRAELGLDAHVTFLGFVDDPSRYLNGLDMFVLSSLSEGFSLSTVQAMAVGLPIVATRSGGPEELLVHDEHGVLVPSGSGTALAEGIKALWGDERRRQRLAGAARERALRSYSIELMADRYAALYRELVEP